MSSKTQEHKYEKESLLFWIVSYSMFSICVCNIFLTFYLINVFEIKKGMKYIEITEASTTNFYGSNVDFGHLVKLDGMLESFSEPLVITNENIKIDLISRIFSSHHKFSQNLEGTVLHNVNNLDIKSNDDHKIFDAQKPKFVLEKPTNSIISNVLHINGEIRSNLNEKLLITAKNDLNVKGNEGTIIESQDVFITADKDLKIVSQNYSVNFFEFSDIFFDPTRFPTADTENGLRKMHVQYKICICYPSGELFLNQAKGREANCIVSKYNNPCK